MVPRRNTRILKRSDRRKFRRRRQRAGFAVFSLAVLSVLGLMMFFGTETGDRAQSEEQRLVRAELPKVKQAPQVAQAERTGAGEGSEKAGEDGESPKDKPEKGEEAGKKERASIMEDPPDPPSNDLWLTVPKMGRYGDYVANTSDQAAMDQGAIKLPETGFPWQPNANTYIAAHVLGYAGTGSYLQFANLPNMTYGDKIILEDSAGTKYVYEVTEILRVTPYDVWVTNPVPGKDMVSLQTCINPPAYDMRLVVRGERVDVIPAG
ncbi:hypothetical protein RxyAA322_04280 [Rubrobacter xylanophilus]|uniref:Peptidase C60, sortase A and B n=1 Tax=Rubrobacter xylanophilus TaxID=49319 RepID=A0A510HF67_9ACTN|nr:class E sortase [Rubrobacter xylanophilus]BBL78574.1 hypothetical protein RxyAA322_04280 [Rubrobacter xylanophilus]